MAGITAGMLLISNFSKPLTAWADASYKDGEYYSEGFGIGGKVPVTVTISSGRISSVVIGTNSETQGIGSKAIEQLPNAIVAANGTDGVDGVSGASVTSKAIFTAVDDCLAQASPGEATEEAATTTDDTEDAKKINSGDDSLNALLLEGIRVDLEDGMYAFQLEGHQGYAWTTDGSGTVAIEKGEGYEIPKSASEREAFFANRIVEYATGLGWNVTHSEQAALADDLEGYLNQADHGDGYSTTYINIPLDDSDFVQIYVIHPNESTDGTSLPERVVQAIRKQTADDTVPQASGKTSTFSGAGITFDSPVSNSQHLSYNALYSYNYDRTLQIIVEPFNGVDILGHVFNIDNEDMTDNPCSAEFFENYCQKFAASRNGWIMSSFSTEGTGGTVSVCAIRSDQEIGSFVYTLASTPTSMEGTTYQLAITIARCPLANAREWSPSIDAMIKSVEPTGAGVLTDYSFARHPGWQITCPDILVSDGYSSHDSILWMDMYTTSNLGFLVTMSTFIAPYGRYYPWSTVGDSALEGEQVISEETRDTAGANVWIRKGISSSSGYDRDLTVDIHSPTNNALGIEFSYDHEDEEFLMPTIDQIINSIYVS